MIYEPIPVKRCTKCKQTLPVVQYHRNKRTKDGFHYICRQCKNAKAKVGYAANPEPAKRRSAKRQAAKSDEIKEYDKRRYQSRREYFLEQSRINRANNIEVVRAYDRMRSKTPHRKIKQKQYQQKRREAVKIYKAIWHQRHKDQRREYNRTHRYRWAESERVKGMRYRAKKRALPRTFSKTDWRNCLLDWKGRCAYCGNPPGLFNNMKLTADHFIPLIAAACPGTVPENMIPACGACNFSKSANDPYEWIPKHFGKRKGTVIIQRIEAYFKHVKQ